MFSVVLATAPGLVWQGRGPGDDGTRPPHRGDLRPPLGITGAARSARHDLALPFCHQQGVLQQPSHRAIPGQRPSSVFRKASLQVRSVLLLLELDNRETGIRDKVQPKRSQKDGRREAYSGYPRSEHAPTPDLRPRIGDFKVEPAALYAMSSRPVGRVSVMPSRSGARPRRGGPQGRGRSAATASCGLISTPLLDGIPRQGFSCPARCVSFHSCSS